MVLVMTKDKQVRPLRLGDLKEVAERDERIRQLEQLNKVLAEQIDRMRPVVDAAVAYRHERPFVFMTPFDKAVDAYERQMAQLAKPSE
jgi:hypothetical protein